MISTGCYSDNQNIISKADFLVGNPAPITRDFRGNNARHKVLMGVIDSGVDYNHPLLSNNIHFKLDPPGTPRARVDFIMMTAGPLLLGAHLTLRYDDGSSIGASVPVPSRNYQRHVKVDPGRISYQPSPQRIRNT